MVIMSKTCHKFGKMVEMMRAKVEEVRRGMIPLVNIFDPLLQCSHPIFPRNAPTTSLSLGKNAICLLWSHPATHTHILPCLFLAIGPHKFKFC